VPGALVGGLADPFWRSDRSLEGDDVAGPLREAGHTVHTPTLPGLESKAANREGIGQRDHVDAVIALIDSTTTPVVLVGHSGGGAIAHAAVDARPDRVEGLNTCYVTAVWVPRAQSA